MGVETPGGSNVATLSAKPVRAPLPPPRLASPVLAAAILGYSHYLRAVFSAYAWPSLETSTVSQQRLEPSAYLRLLRDHRLLRSATVRLPSRDGLGFRVQSVSLSEAAAWESYTAACGVQPADGQGAGEGSGVNGCAAAEFYEAVARCGLAKYGPVACMETDAARVEGAVLNLLGLADEEQVTPRTAPVEVPHLAMAGVMHAPRHARVQAPRRPGVTRVRALAGAEPSSQGLASGAF